MSCYGGSRLPFDSPENSPNPPAARRDRSRPVQGRGRPLAAVIAMSFYGGCRLTALKTAQTQLQLAEAAADLSRAAADLSLPCNVFLL